MYRAITLWLLVNSLAAAAICAAVGDDLAAWMWVVASLSWVGPVVLAATDDEDDELPEGE